MKIAPGRSRAGPMTRIPPLVMFDLDGTLAESKQPLTSEMARNVAALLARTKVAVVSGGALPQYLAQVVARLPADANLENLYILPTSGAALHEWRDGQWRKVYEERISENDAGKIQAAMEDGARASGVVDMAAPTRGPRIEYRGGQVTFSALGQKAPPAEKKAWDPDHAKRRALQAAIAARLPAGFTAAMGGSTTIDVLRAGVDKAYGIRRLAERLGIPESDALYIGDELVPAGNDEAVFRTNAQVRAVSSPQDTARAIVSLLSS